MDQSSQARQISFFDAVLLAVPLPYVAYCCYLVWVSGVVVWKVGFATSGYVYVSRTTVIIYFVSLVVGLVALWLRRNPSGLPSWYTTSFTALAISGLLMVVGIWTKAVGVL